MGRFGEKNTVLLLGLIQPVWNGVVLAPVNTAEIALYEVAETNTQRGYLGKIGDCFTFKGVQMVRLEGQNSPSGAVSGLHPETRKIGQYFEANLVQFILKTSVL